MFLKIIACEIAFREICYAVARSPNLCDLQFLTQGHHDAPAAGRVEIQQAIDAVPAGRYDAILLGYGLCSNILTGLAARHTPLIVPRAHDCITFFLGSKERYREFFENRPGTYYYTSGWLECPRRRGVPSSVPQSFLPAQAICGAGTTYEEWVKKYGEEQARYLAEVMGGWSAAYQRGVLIDYDFTQPLNLREAVKKICAERGWEFEEVAGDFRFFQRWVDGDWADRDFLRVPPGHRIVPTFNDAIIAAEPFPTPPTAPTER